MRQLIAIGLTYLTRCSRCSAGASGPEPPAGPEGPKERAAPRRRGETGSAYIIALLVLVVLTIVGLTLTLITQSEVRQGANERSINRALYASDSGIAVAVAKVLVSNDYTPTTFKLNTTLQDTGASPTITFADQITVTPLVPIADAPCNLCQINQGNDYYMINHAGNTDSVRNGLGAATPQPIADKTLGVMIALQPWQHSASSLAASVSSGMQNVHF
ncbi:MAG: hypothetical protein M3O15_00875 [Acidobacteriota bacterium]|nr:hypothetical protein [Acidobacteriota bacterium]